MSASEFKYAAFLAHSSKDDSIVEKVLKQLENRGLKCCYSKRDFVVGGLLFQLMEQAVNDSWKTIAFISKDFLESPYCEMERELALQKAKDTTSDILVPILLDIQISELPPLLRTIKCVEIEADDFEIQLMRAMGVQDPNTLPTYQELQCKNEDLDKENQVLKKRIIEYEIKTAILNKDVMCAKEDAKLANEVRRNNICTSNDQSTVCDVYTKLQDMVVTKMDNMDDEQVEGFFIDIIPLLQVALVYFSTNRAILMTYAAVLWYIGDSKLFSLRYTDTMFFYEKVLRTLQKLYGMSTANKDISQIQFDIGKCHFLQEQFDEAAMFFFQSLQVEKELAYPLESNGIIANVHCMLGKCQMRMNDKSQYAVDNLSTGLEMYKTLEGNWDDEIKDCFCALETTYLHSGENTKARDCRKERDRYFMEKTDYADCVCTIDFDDEEYT